MGILIEDAVGYLSSKVYSCPFQNNLDNGCIKYILNHHKLYYYTLLLYNYQEIFFNLLSILHTLSCGFCKSDAKTIDKQ